MYTSIVLVLIQIDRKTGPNRYGDVLDAAEHLAAGKYSSAANALAVMCRESPLYLEAMRTLKANGSALTRRTEATNQAD